MAAPPLEFDAAYCTSTVFGDSEIADVLQTPVAVWMKRHRFEVSPTPQ